MNTKKNTLVLFFASFVFLNAGATRINIGGLFPLISDHGSGKHELAAVMLAFSQVNNKTDGVADTVLVDFQAQLIARDSKGIPTEAALQAANMVGINCYTNVCQQDNYQKNAPIMGFLGPGSPDAVAKVQRLLQLPHVDIAQMIYSSRSPVLSNTEKFPILSRLAQTDNTQPGAMLDVLRLLLNASHVNLLAASDKASVLHARMFQAAAVSAGVKVVRKIHFSSPLAGLPKVELAHVNKRLQNLRSKECAPTVVFTSSAADIAHVVRVSRQHSYDGIFIFPEFSAPHHDDIEILTGTFSVSVPDMLPPSEAYDRFARQWRSQASTKWNGGCSAQRDPTGYYLWRERGRIAGKCLGIDFDAARELGSCADNATCNAEIIPTSALHAYDAAIVMLTALDKVLKSDWTLPANTSGALLHTAILATKINGTTGPIQFEDNGDRKASSNREFRVYNHQGLSGHRLIGRLRDGKFFNCSTKTDRNCVSHWLLPGDKKYDYDAGKPVPPAECQATCECTGNRGYYYSDLPFRTNKTTLQPYNYGKSYGAFCYAHDDLGGAFDPSSAWAKESWCYMPCDKSICPGVPRSQTAYLWRATVNNIDLCYSYEVCGGVDFFTGEAKICMAGGGYYINNACTCADGQYIVQKNGAPTCSKCPPGYSCPDGYHAVPCARGFYSSEEGAFKCTPCGGSTYAVGGASECTACEDNTERKVGSVGGNRSECKCLRDFYLPPGSVPGDKCIECPPNSICDGGATQPFPVQRYTAYENVSGDVFMVLCDQAAILSTALQKVDVGRYSAEELKAMTWINASGQGKLYLDRCIGGRNFSCGPRFKGNLCHYCAEGYFPGNGHEYCWPCAKTATANTFLLIGGSMLVFSLWGILSFAIDSMSAAILMNYLQVINMIQEFTIAYPTTLRIYAVPIMLSGFDIDFLNTIPCIWPDGVGFYHIWVSTFFMPIIFTACQLVVYGVAVFVRKLRRRQSLRARRRCPWCPSTTYDLIQLRYRLIALWISMLIAFYVTLVEKTLQGSGLGGTCRPVSKDGTVTVMKKDPNVQCWTSDHVWYLVPSYISMVVYVIGIPTGILALVIQLRRKNLLADPRVLATTSSLYRHYEPSYFWWTPLSMVRSLLVVSIRVTLGHEPLLQISWGSVVVVLFMVLQFAARPYVRGRMDFLEGLCAISIFFYVFASATFSPNVGASSNEAPLLVLLATIATLAQSVFTICVCVIVLAFEIREKCLRASAETRFKRLSTSPTILTYMAMRQIMGAKLSGDISSLVTDMFSKIDLDNNGILERDEIRSFVAALTFEDEEMKDAEHLDAAVNEIFETYDVDGNGYIDVQEFSGLIRDASTTGELQYTLVADKLNSWARKTNNDVLAAGYFELDKWMSAVVSDESALSIYEGGPKAELYRTLLDECPYLIDFAASAPPPVIAVLRRFLFLLEKVQPVTHISGLLSEYIVDIDRCSVFYWLAFRASQMQRQTFLNVLVDVHNSQNKAHALNPCNWSHNMRRMRHKLQSKEELAACYPIERLREILHADSDKIDQEISKEQKKLWDHEKWRTLERSSFRPTDVDSKKFKAEKFKQRWGIAVTKMKLLSKRKKVSPVPDHDPHREKEAHWIASTESAKSAKTISVAPVKTKSFLRSKKVAPKPDNRPRAVDPDQTDARKASATDSTNGPPVRIHKPPSLPASDVDRKHPRHERSKTSKDTDFHDTVKIEQDATIHEL